MNDLDPVDAARQSLKIRETAMIVLAVLFPVSMLLAGIPLTWMLKTPAPLWIIAGVYVPLIAGVAVWHQRFRCPRCGESFFRRGSAMRPLAKGCMHCGLEIMR